MPREKANPAFKLRPADKKATKMADMKADKLNVPTIGEPRHGKKGRGSLMTPTRQKLNKKVSPKKRK